MQKSRVISIIVLSSLAGTLALAQPAGVFAADKVLTAGPTSFSEVYATTINTRRDNENEFSRQADHDAKENKYVEATARYLAAARLQLALDSFERARPNLDKCFLNAERLSIADQDEMMSALSETVWKTRNAYNDDEVSKYMAQQRLRLLRKRRETTAADWYIDAKTLAFKCSQHKRFKEAEALLLETLKELQSIEPLPEGVGSCKHMLARVYEDAGDLEKAKQYYSEWAQFGKDTHKSDRRARALGNYVHFLIDHKMFVEAIPVADEYLKLVTSPEQAGLRDRVSFGIIARGLADADVNLSDKYYRAAFENQKILTETAMNAGYGLTICEWAEMLNKHGRGDDAIAVLNEGMDFCRNSKWPDALDTYMPQMAKKSEQYLRAAGRVTDANNLHASFVKEMASHKQRLAQDKEHELVDALKNPHTKPVQRVSALTDMAYRSFDEGKYRLAVYYLEEAVTTYEKNAADKDNSRMYEYFRDVRIRLSKCGRAHAATPMLLRIIRARMVQGFPDPDRMGYRTHCGVRAPVNPFDDLFPVYSSWDRANVVDPMQDAMLKQLLAEAKAADKISTVVYLLTRMCESQSPDIEKVALFEETEVWKAKENDPAVLLRSMMRTADMYLYLKQYDKMLDKCKAAIAIAEKPNGPTDNTLSMLLERLANQLIAVNGQQDNAEYLYMAGYRRSLHERGSYGSHRFLKTVDNLANMYRDSNDVSRGAKLLERALEITKAEDGEDGTLARAWLMKLSAYYVLAGQRDKALRTNEEFFVSITKPGMSITTSTSDDMTKLARLFREHSYSSEAEKIESRMKELEQQQCARH